MKKISVNRNKKTPLKRTAVKEKAKKTIPFTIVAIGASVGGLEATSTLFQNLPSNTGMAFIYVQHLSPDHKSFITSILSRKTKMVVQEINDMELMKPDNVYVIPHNKGIRVVDGRIKLVPRSKVGKAISIDVLFSSLALTHKENVIGVILSGNAKDGTIGLKEIKDAGGMTFAQDGSAQAHSMPQSAIDAGVVDFVLSPQEMAIKLSRIGKHGFKKNSALMAKKVTSEINGDDVETILGILHKEVNVDFSRYKMATIKRRINNRMMQGGIRSIKEYAKLLPANHKEIDALYKDLLINVTSFFRNKENFLYFKNSLLPKMFKNKTSDDKLRIWVPACSTGQEVYAIALLITEFQDKNTIKIPVQIFATDLSDQAIQDARNGEYSEDDIEPISKERVKRFFTKVGTSYRIIKQIRDMCVFASHNILRDPPYLHLDLISCRNLLIYLDADAQKKALSIFHFALNDTGYLMLGKSETVGTSSQLFTQVTDEFSIYSKKKSPGFRGVPQLIPNVSGSKNHKKSLKPVPKRNTSPDLTELDRVIDSTLLSRYVPACAIINKDMEILMFRGSTHLFLRHQAGNASLNILKMTRPEFTFDLRNSINKAITSKQIARKSGIELNSDVLGSVGQLMTIEVCPLKIEWDEPLLLVVFTVQDQVEKYIENETGRKKYSSEKDRKIEKQAEELKDVHAEMQSIIEAREIAYQELQAANEEIVSTSEEFQSLNEELETSKEEIEATNEELTSTNQELRTRNEQLAETYEFATAIAATLHEPLLILEKGLRIKSANKAFYKKFMVLRKEVEGKLLYELGNGQWDIPRLRELLENVIQKNTFFNEYEIAHEFPDIGRKTMLLNARQIVQKTQNEQLILLAFTDITKTATKRKEETRGLENIIDDRTIALEKSYKVLEEKNLILERANKELETFSYVSSHDLQEPLRKIQNFATVLLKEERKVLSSDGKIYLKRMEESVKRMQMLIEDLLDYSRAKNTKHNFEKIYLNKIAEEVVADFKEALKEKKGVVIVKGRCQASVIPFQFRQIIQNLISNSLKFSHPKRYPRITIKSETINSNVLKNDELLPNTKYCHMSVTDNGIGFDPKYKDRIFEVFQRLHEFDEYKGTGIGLAICKRIVENHNGIITAASKIDRGAQFDIYIPVS